MHKKGRSGFRSGLIKLNQQLTYENDLLKWAGKRRYTFGPFIFFRGLKPFTKSQHLISLLSAPGKNYFTEISLL